ncbi:putative two-component histidine kinase [Gordonia hirsuta DSM 44140 = NBRC 16056]|uniref:Putative two-component histidine kinase n=1 Tax=Gordonia hirsuta DSM 44140 = NBRC 16056 TaxID=1121927 RepID=L7LEK4_9ACTN|nr:PAS domain-containing sensor histidine kinase [Gordonia hirsuta]GAC58458.1 putative two-component histidine kinase [Gordonia hirsuta DSM 44140 = NBRC 16056]
MATLHDLLAEHTRLSDRCGQHLQRLVAEWQLLADLSFADYLLAVRETTGALVYVAQVRPNTASTLFPHDQVGRRIDAAGDTHGVGGPGVGAPAEAAFVSGRIERAAARQQLGALPVETIAVPVVVDGAVIAVLTRAGAARGELPPSPLESAYREAAEALCTMVVEGAFPLEEANTLGLSTPRAGDGFIQLDRDGRVVYASPNAVSAVHRMGWQSELGTVRLADLIAGLLADPLDAVDVGAVLAAACGDETGPMPEELPLRMELDARRASVLLRVVPLRSGGVGRGAVVLIRDVTEVKRRDLALISKDATIREIHHRVKNNLQSVSALLRLQARRSDNPETAAALGEAVRRVSSIALVHEMLSGSVDEEVDLDAVVDRLVPTLIEVWAPSGGAAQIAVRRGGRLGVLPADLAMPLVQVLAEVIQNSIEHGFAADREGASIVVGGQRDLRGLTVRITDNGVGLPAGIDPASPNSLGLQIVSTLVSNDLGGRIEYRPGPDGMGTSVDVYVPLH